MPVITVCALMAKNVCSVTQGGGVYEPFSVPLSTAYIEIYGDDAEGEVLLAVFPLPEPELVEDDRAQHMWVTLEGGQTVAIEIALGDGPCGEVSEYCIQIAYAESKERDDQRMHRES